MKGNKRDGIEFFFSSFLASWQQLRGQKEMWLRTTKSAFKKWLLCFQQSHVSSLMQELIKGRKIGRQPLMEQSGSEKIPGSGLLQKLVGVSTLWKSHLQRTCWSLDSFLLTSKQKFWVLSLLHYLSATHNRLCDVWYKLVFVVLVTAGAACWRVGRQSAFVITQICENVSLCLGCVH